MGSKKSEATRAKISSSQPNSLQIEVTDLELNTKTSYPSIRAAARALNISPPSIYQYFKNNQTKPIKGRYVIRKI
jgi:hypothetical protein